MTYEVEYEIVTSSDYCSQQLGLVMVLDENGLRVVMGKRSEEFT